jgi:hypothetical protein
MGLMDKQNILYKELIMLCHVFVANRNIALSYL